MNAAELARLQFAVTAGLHFLFVALTLGLVTVVAVTQTRATLARDPVARATGMRRVRFWGGLYVINYALGIVSGIVQEFQFGLNWSGLSHAMGNVIGALPLLEGELLTVLRVPVVIVLCAWVLRDAALWFRTALPSGGWRRTWDVVLPVTSAVLALTWGLLLAALIRGLSTDGDGHAVAAFSDLAHPFALVCAAVVVVGSLRQGVLFAARRLPGTDPEQPRLAGFARRLLWPLVGAVLLAAAAGALLLGSAPLVALPVAVGVANGTTVLATRSGEGALTLSGAIADSASLGLLAVVALPALAAVAYAQVWIWRVFARQGAR
ncbi:cytochrome ubiquinol oxidase subunit I [Streptomyces sp. NPDC047971]|uniref:cytochrome ubiquinol oxidase subunit I n=1 Tax=Streptomyces sp. NPDC047971 TaxID=3154499 RepID=UPI0033D61D67